MPRKYNIPVFVPHKGCPHDCIFCNQRHITGTYGDMDAEKAKKIIDDSLSTIDGPDPDIEIAFFGGSFTGIDKKLMTELLSLAYSYIKSGRVHGIRLSTRPDYIDRDILSVLKSYGVTCIELGVQSMDDAVLSLSRRGHTREDVISASGLIKEHGIPLGLQMMVGLYGSDAEKDINTAHEIAALSPDCVRIYPVLVLRDTLLAALYEVGLYTPLKLDAAVNLTAQILQIFHKKNINVIRIGLMPSDEISVGGAVLAGPFHPSFGELAQSRVFYDKLAAKASGSAGDLVVYVNPADLSIAIGNKRSNIERIKREHSRNILIKPLKSVERGNIL